jgi:hypothetical protein
MDAPRWKGGLQAAITLYLKAVGFESFSTNVQFGSMMHHAYA